MKRKRPLNAIDVHCHGTYAWDLGDRIKSLGKVSREQAAELVRIPDELRDQEYMWINKGWIVEGRPYSVGHGEEAIVVGDGEVPPYSTPLNVGDKLVYLADGNYYRIEVVS